MDLLPTGVDDTPYRLLTADGVSTVETSVGGDALTPSPYARATRSSSSSSQ